MSGGANHSRPTSMTYPNGRVLNYNYSTGLNSNISRLSSLSDNSGTLESYDYLGAGTVVRRAHPEPDVDLTYIKQSGEGNGDAGDQYTGLDRFGRVVDQRWLDASSGTATDRFKYGYNRNSNRTYRENAIDAVFSELYAYDSLNQLNSFDRGTLNANKDGISGTPSRSLDWDFDALGNFDSVTTDGSGQTRSHNRQNEITSVQSATTPTYDANGNLTKDETGKQFIYDAWNRLVEVKSSGGATLVTYEYDGLNRRVQETKSGTTTDFYYSANWQVLEEQVEDDTTAQYVWSPVHVDAMVLRDRDTDGNGTLDERLYVQQDANFNVTALVDTSGNVVERYVYDPFGAVTIYNADWSSTRSSSDYDWKHLHQGGTFDTTTGMYHFRNREYSPTLGRWLQIDPLGFDAGDVDLYRYVGNGPITYNDPTGEVIFVVVAIVAVVVVLAPIGQSVVNSPPPSGPIVTDPRFDQPAWIRDPNFGRSPAWGGDLWDLPSNTPWYGWCMHYFLAGASTPGCGMAGSGRINPNVPRPIPPVSIFGGRTFSEWGRNVIRWGTGAPGARARIATMTQAEIQQLGITREQAQAARDFYTCVLARDPQNAAAAARIELMDHILSLLGG